MSEQELQSKCIKYAKAKGYFVLKVIRCNVSGYPDCTLFKDGKTIFVEFKAEKGVQSHLQKYVEKQIIDQGFKYYLIKSLEKFKEIVAD
jgi:hypothetical protein